MLYPIRIVARETGLTPHAIRAWEKRYRAVVPERTGSRRRFYTEGDLRRLKLLRALTQSGFSISAVAQLPEEDLQALIKHSGAEGAASPQNSRGAPAMKRWSTLLEECVEAIRAFDEQRFRTTLETAAIELGYNLVLRHLIAPLIERIGDLWSEGELRMSHEHFATVVVRIFLLNPARQYAASDSGLRLVATTPQGQLHELGAVMAAALAAEQGWHAVYLGPSLPAAEIAGVARQHGARSVLLSIIYPGGDSGIERELQDLRRFLPENVSILVGGRAAKNYGSAIKKTGSIMIRDLAHLQVVLENISAQRD